MNAKSNWSIEDEKKLIELKSNGKRWDEIYQILGDRYSITSLQSKYKRLKEMGYKNTPAVAIKQENSKTFEEIIKNSITKINKKEIKLKIKKKKGKINETAILILSDLHIGEKTTGLEIYNTAIFQKRWQYLLEKIIYITDNILRNAYNIDELNIFLLGDMITGETLFPTQPHQIDMVVIDQIFTGAKMVAEGLNELSKYFQKINIYTVNGNHGRVSKISAETTNWDYIFYKSLEQYLTNNKRIKFFISKDDFKQIINVLGFQFMLAHGDLIKMYNRTPHYGIENSVARWVSFYIEKYPYLKYFCFGHFHTAGIYNWNNRKIILNGTFNSGGQYAEKVIKLTPSLTQWFLGLNKDRGITWQYEMDFKKIV